MSLITIARKARKLWSNPDVPHSTNRHNRRQWIRSVTMLGPKWKLHAPIPSDILRASAAQLQNLHRSAK